MSETPLEHLGRYRIEIAAGLLTGDGLSIEQIAGRVGYRATASFAKAFKRITGMPPGEYRRRARNQLRAPHGRGFAAPAT